MPFHGVVLYRASESIPVLLQQPYIVCGCDGRRTGYPNYGAFADCVRDKTFITPEPSAESSLVGALIEVFPYIVVEVEAYIKIFLAMERDFFQNIVCAKNDFDTLISHSKSTGNMVFLSGFAEISVSLKC